MTKEQIAPWIEKLTKVSGKERKVIVGEMCKENGLNIGDAWKLLKETGFDPKVATPAYETPDNTQTCDTPPASKEKPLKKRVKHEHLKSKNLIAGNKTIEFDADGIAELDAADAERLLTIPGYTEVKE
ncbi:MAG: hypothetical protein LBF83_06425 [Spirochaetaceae bacterium]|jgi:hypothetical protein|nr:hypothetical protein [Spirochaetaceae bacterium]